MGFNIHVSQTMYMRVCSLADLLTTQSKLDSGCTAVPSRLT